MRGLVWFSFGLALVLIIAGALLLGPYGIRAGDPRASATPAATPTTPAPTGASLTWQGSVEGECARLRVEALSQLYVAPCDGDWRAAALTQEELHTLLGYLARLAPLTHEDAGSTLTLMGRGRAEATEADRAALSAWAGGVYRRLAEARWRETAERSARTLLGQRIGPTPAEAAAAALDPVVWPDACLGVAVEGRTCAPGEVPGYRVSLRTADSTYVYHTDRRGSARLAEVRAPATGTSAPASRTPTPSVTPGVTSAPPTTPSPAAASPTPTPALPVSADYWRAEYYDNVDLAGEPVLITRESNLSHQWGRRAPAPEVPADGFSARFTRRVQFEEGRYDFRLEADDGVRLWVSGALLVDRWSGGHRVDYVSGQAIGAGEHLVVVEYLEREGNARLQVSWQRVDATPTPLPEPVITDWRAEYYPNKELAGRPVLVRNEVQVGFDWGEGSPDALLAPDGFSARFTRSLEFAPGRYRLSAVADDGVRVYVDGRLVIDGWQPGIRRVLVHDLPLGGAHTLRVDYFEDGGAAAVYFGWAALDVTAEPTPPPTEAPATPTAYWRVAYYDNAELAGAPVAEEEVAEVAFDWGEGAAHPTLGADRFSARYTRTLTFPEGRYRLHLVVDDGARLYVDGALVLDEWQGDIRRHVVADLDLAGEHTVTIEYYEREGGAALFFGWEALDGAGAASGVRSDALPALLEAAPTPPAAER